MDSGDNLDNIIGVGNLLFVFLISLYTSSISLSANWSSFLTKLCRADLAIFLLSSSSAFLIVCFDSEYWRHFVFDIYSDFFWCSSIGEICFTFFGARISSIFLNILDSSGFDSNIFISYERSVSSSVHGVRWPALKSLLF